MIQQILFENSILRSSYFVPRVFEGYSQLELMCDRLQCVLVPAQMA